MTGAWEVPLPKPPIPRQLSLHTGQSSKVHRMSPSMDPPPPVRAALCLCCI